MQSTGTFKVTQFSPTELSSPIETASPVGVTTMEKEYEGDVVGRSATLFTYAFDHATGVGTYVAMESFQGSMNGNSGAFNFAHSSTSLSNDRNDDFFIIVPGSGTGSFSGIRGSGGIAIDPDDTHRIWFDYELLG